MESVRESTFIEGKDYSLWASYGGYEGFYTLIMQGVNGKSFRRIFDSSVYPQKDITNLFTRLKSLNDKSTFKDIEVLIQKNLHPDKKIS